ncbi:MAG: nucleotide exchange factor GrpE [Candidatus Obscuribacterales bacterium]|nr:nucleotide exchange factor GrpE [Candidatus Obscuribacterales bacterium]
MEWLRSIFLRLSGAANQLQEKDEVILSQTRLLEELQRTVDDQQHTSDEQLRTITELRDVIERERNIQSTLIAHSVENAAESLIQELSGSVIQLVTLDHLSNNEAQEVRGTDALAIAMRMVRALEESGVCLLGKPGEMSEFDERRHEVVARNVVVQSGETITIKMPGVTFRDRIIRRAMVAPVPLAETQTCGS